MTDWKAANHQDDVKAAAAAVVGQAVTRTMARMLAPVGLMALFRARRTPRGSWHRVELVCSLCEKEQPALAVVEVPGEEPAVLQQVVAGSDHLRGHHPGILAYAGGASE